MSHISRALFSIKQLNVITEMMAGKALRPVDDATVEVIAEDMRTFGFDQSKRGAFMMGIQSSHSAHFTDVAANSVRGKVWNLNDDEIDALQSIHLCTLQVDADSALKGLIFIDGRHRHKSIVRAFFDRVDILDTYLYFDIFINIPTSQALVMSYNASRIARSSVPCFLDELICYRGLIKHDKGQLNTAMRLSTKQVVVLTTLDSCITPSAENVIQRWRSLGLFSLSNIMERGNRMFWTLLNAFSSGVVRSKIMRKGRKSALCTSLQIAGTYSHRRFILSMQGFLFAAIVVVYQQSQRTNGILSATGVLERVSSCICNAMLDILPKWKGGNKSLSDARKMFWALFVTSICSVTAFEQDMEQAHSRLRNLLEGVGMLEFACEDFGPAKYLLDSIQSPPLVSPAHEMEIEQGSKKRDETSPPPRKKIHLDASLEADIGTQEALRDAPDIPVNNNPVVTVDITPKVHVADPTLEVTAALSSVESAERPPPAELISKEMMFKARDESDETIEDNHPSADVKDFETEDVGIPDGMEVEDKGGDLEEEDRNDKVLPSCPRIQRNNPNSSRRVIRSSERLRSKKDAPCNKEIRPARHEQSSSYAKRKTSSLKSASPSAYATSARVASPATELDIEVRKKIACASKCLDLADDYLQQIEIVQASPSDERILEIEPEDLDNAEKWIGFFQSYDNCYGHKVGKVLDEVFLKNYKMEYAVIMSKSAVMSPDKRLGNGKLSLSTQTVIVSSEFNGSLLNIAKTCLIHILVYDIMPETETSLSIRGVDSEGIKGDLQSFLASEFRKLMRKFRRHKILDITGEGTEVLKEYLNVTRPKSESIFRKVIAWVFDGRRSTSVGIFEALRSVVLKKCNCGGHSVLGNHNEGVLNRHPERHNLEKTVSVPFMLTLRPSDSVISEIGMQSHVSIFLNKDTPTSAADCYKKFRDDGTPLELGAFISKEQAEKVISEGRMLPLVLGQAYLVDSESGVKDHKNRLSPFEQRELFVSGITDKIYWLFFHDDSLASKFNHAHDRSCVVYERQLDHRQVTELYSKGIQALKKNHLVVPVLYPGMLEKLLKSKKSYECPICGAVELLVDYGSSYTFT